MITIKGSLAFILKSRNDYKGRIKRLVKSNGDWYLTIEVTA